VTPEIAINRYPNETPKIKIELNNHWFSPWVTIYSVNIKNKYIQDMREILKISWTNIVII
jgi:hypothetical protein